MYKCNVIERYLLFESPDLGKQQKTTETIMIVVGAMLISKLCTASLQCNCFENRLNWESKHTSNSSSDSVIVLLAGLFTFLFHTKMNRHNLFCIEQY